MPSIALPVSLRGQLLYSTRIFDPLSLFAANEPGIWLDPSDLTTMFQDRAGSTPVTTPGQSVGYRRDKSGRNNHAVANSDAARGIYGIEPLGGRRNLLTFSEQFDNAVWVKAGTTVTANAATDPIGGTSADKLVSDASTGFHRATVSPLALAATNHTFSVYMKSAEYTLGGLSLFNGTSFVARSTFDLSAGTVSTTDGAATITSVGNGWYLCTVTGLGNATITPYISVNSVFTFAGTAGSGILIWGAQLEAGSTATAYQRVTTQYDVTEAGKQTLHYVQYDGSDDGYVTPTITPGIDKVQVFAGVRKLSDAAAGTVLEFSDSSDTNNGAFFLRAPQAAAANYIFRSKGTVVANTISPSSYAAPITNVVTGLGDIVGDVSRIRVNGAQVAETLTDQGTGNYLAYPLYIGRRGGTTLPFNGRDYGLLVRFGANLDASTIAATESWLNQKTGAY